MPEVRVDFDLCESNGVCQAMAPDVFELDDEDLLQVADPTVTDDNRDRIERAVASCPKSALSIAGE